MRRNRHYQKKYLGNKLKSIALLDIMSILQLYRNTMIYNYDGDEKLH